MTSYYLELTFGVRNRSGHRDVEGLEEHLEDLMGALLDEPGATDADVAAELATGRVTISLYVDAIDDATAISHALVVARSAIHKAGGFTGGWSSSTRPGSITIADTYNVRVQPAALADC